MAGRTESPHRQSLYMKAAIRQVSSDNGSRSTPVSPQLPVMKTFGEEFRLTCAVCFKDLREPKQLKSCYHIFCKDCLEPLLEQAEDGAVKCPVGTCKISCPFEDISKAVSSNTYLHGIQGQVCLYTESGQVFCSDESHEPKVTAIHFCLECGRNMCDSCHIDHRGNEANQSHHTLKLLKTSTDMTIGIERSRNSPACSVDSPDMNFSYKCPICRNTDTCVHEQWMDDLMNDKYRKDDLCPVPEHASEGKKLLAFCECNVAICETCSKIEHKSHNTFNIGSAAQDKLNELRLQKKRLTFKEEMFNGAVQSCEKAERKFNNHVGQVEREMIDRKGLMHAQVESEFNVAFSLIEQTGQKQAELHKQSGEMRQENQFIKTGILLADRALDEGATNIEIIRIWQGLKGIVADLEGEETKSNKNPDGVFPQNILEDRLVLPAPSCMNPDLRILKKVGVESTVLHQAFTLKAEDELLLFYGILPLTDTEALVSCKTQACATSVVQYSNVDPEHYSVRLPDEGQYCIIAVPGSGIVATLYQSPGGCGRGKGIKQVLFWDQALDMKMTELEAQGAGDKLKVIAETELPPRGVAVTKDNHLVLCMAKDPPMESDGDGGDGGESCIMIMTMRGDVLRRERFSSLRAGRTDGPYFPRYITVNINGDICVTDERDKSIIIFNDKLKNKRRFINPYKGSGSDAKNAKFSPRGICHDSFGRLVIADPNNNAVLRLVYGAEDQAGEFEEILKDGLDGVKDLSSPTLVALGKGPRLWVVCRSNIQVFDYIKE